MRINNLKKLNVEDFSQEDQELINQLAFILNPLLEQITQAFSKNIDFDNLNQDVIVFEATVNAAGTPNIKLELRNTLRTRPRGLQTIRVENLTLDGTFPSSTPLVSYTLENNNIVVTNITGLDPGKRYRLTVISYG